MGYPTLVLCGLIASPGDTQTFRDLMPKVFRTWNNTHAEREGVTLRDLLWEDLAPGLGQPAQGQISRELGRADFLVALFNSRVGSPVDAEISGTVQEISDFEAAQKPVMIYFSDAPVDRITAASPQFQQLSAWRQQYEKTKGLLGRYTDPHDLEAKILAHLSTVVRKLKEDIDSQQRRQLAEVAAIQVAVERNRFLRSIVARLNKFEKLTDRCANRNPELKESISRFFWLHMHGEIFSKGVSSLFFESGSTLVYLAEKFVARCKDDHGALDRWKIKTNNIITYLDFVLFERVDVVLSPYGPPDNEYGATFGALQLPDVDPPGPDEVDWNIDAKIRSLIETQASELLPLSSPSLILATASGMELDVSHRYPGLHVGSYQNMLFKRALLKSLHPAVIFLDEDKISTVSATGKFVFNKCYPVFDNKKAWETVLRSAPLAFCIGFRNAEALGAVKQYFDGFGFREKACKDNVLLIKNAAWDGVFGKRVDVRI